MQLRVNDSRIIGALALALALCACADVDDNKDAWFAKPFQVVSRNAGYTFSELQESKDRAKHLTAADLVDGNGACPTPLAQPANAAQPAPAAQAGPAAQPMAAAAPGSSPVNGAAPAPDGNSLLGGGVALGMSECDVVFRAGQPNSVQLGKNPNGDRTAVLTFSAGPRPGIYHFERGALMEVEGVPASPAPPKVAKKKPSNPNKQKQASQD